MPPSTVIVPLVLVVLPDTVLLPRDNSVPPVRSSPMLLFVKAELDTRAVPSDTLRPLFPLPPATDDSIVIWVAAELKTRNPFPPLFAAVVAVAYSDAFELVIPLTPLPDAITRESAALPLPTIL